VLSASRRAGTTSTAIDASNRTFRSSTIHASSRALT
jgi:hypothetical protein